MKAFMIMIVCLSTLFFSCKKENEMKISQKEPVSGSTNVAMKISTSGTQTIYEVDPVILANFQHYCQLTAATSTPAYLSSIDASKACGPTSYMMAAACIAKWSDPNTAYTCSGSKLSNIVSITGTPTILTGLESYAVNYDNSFIAKASLYTSNRSSMNQFIKDQLTANKFVIVAINMYGSNSRVNNSNLYLNSSSNPDLDPTSETTSTYITTKYGSYQKTNNCRGTSLITTSGVYGHIILLVRLVTNPDGTGTVEYIDPIANTKPSGTSNKRYVSFTRLLNSMSVNGCSNNYDALAIGKK